MGDGGTESVPGSPVRAPLGAFEARLDDKGRLKLPTKILEYLKSMGTEFFLTSVDGKLGSIYPLPVWEKNEQLVEQQPELAEAYTTMMTMASHYGKDVEIDAQGRILIHPDLRRDLGFEGQPVRLQVMKGVVHVVAQAQYDADLALARQNVEAHKALAAKGGFR